MEVIYHRLIKILNFTFPNTLFAGQTYKHLGCYKDGTPYDLQGNEVTFATLTLNDCAKECRNGGYPYAGLQEGMKCICGDTFGNYHKMAGECS